MKSRTIDVRALVADDDWKIVEKAADTAGLRIGAMEAGRAASDIVALPTDLAILDPDLMSDVDWDNLCEWYRKYPFFGGCFLLTRSPKHKSALPDAHIIDEPFSVDGIIRAQKRVETMNDILNCMLSYDELLSLVCHRIEEVCRFEELLRNETSWLTSPASTRFHLAKTGGLVEHSVNVANTMLKLRATLAPDVSEESCVITGLYHDIGKAGLPGKPYYLPNPSEWHVRNRGIAYVVSDDIVHMDIATRSLYLVSQYIPLSGEEAQAIRYHDGQYIEENRSVAHKETKLTRLIQYADNWSGGVLEDRKMEKSR